MSNFVAINYISCTPAYRDRFEYLFSTRAGEIDKLPGFINMHVLKPQEDGDEYLIVSYWETEDNFVQWTKSESFLKGHKRGFEDIVQAKKEGKPAPMTSSFKKYKIIST